MRIFFTIFIFLPLISFSQYDKIDSIVKEIDSLIEKKEKFKKYYSVPAIDCCDDTTYSIFTHYIDSVNCILGKTIYEANFRGKEKVTFYFNNTTIIKVIVNNDWYDDILYAEKDYLISISLRKLVPEFAIWTSEKLKDMAKSRILNKIKICK
jgi:hypothetical protein